MAPALTAIPWIEVLGIVARRAHSETTTTLACLLQDIVNETTDPAVGRILDRYASQMLEGS